MPILRHSVRTPGGHIPPEFTDAARGERLQRVMADAGVASRRDCEAMVLAGRVEVNGLSVAGLPAWVDPVSDDIAVDGKPIRRQPSKPVYVMLNKPPRTLTSARDEPGADRTTVADLVRHPSGASLFPVGRLDYDTVGLVIMTNDGELANRLTHPRYGVPKTYRAVVAGRFGEEQARELERGIVLSDRKEGRTVGGSRTTGVEVSIIHQDDDKATLDVVLREGRNRQVRRMLAAVELPVRKLERTAVGPVRLSRVPRGGWRDLTHAEVFALRRACGMARDGDDQGPKAQRPTPSKPTTSKPTTSRPTSSRPATPRPTREPIDQRPGPRPTRSGTTRPGPARSAPTRSGPTRSAPTRSGPSRPQRADAAQPPTPNRPANPTPKQASASKSSSTPKPKPALPFGQLPGHNQGHNRGDRTGTADASASKKRPPRAAAAKPPSTTTRTRSTPPTTNTRPTSNKSPKSSARTKASAPPSASPRPTPKNTPKSGPKSGPKPTPRSARNNGPSTGRRNAPSSARSARPGSPKAPRRTTR